MAENPDNGGWEMALGRKDWRHHRVTEKLKEAYEEVVSREHRDLAYDHQVPFLRVRTSSVLAVLGH